MSTFPLYIYDPRISRYRSKRTGRLVPVGAVRRALDVALANEANASRALAGQLRSGEITVEMWHLGMREIVKRTQLYAAAAGRGGWAQMDARAFGTVGQRVRVQNDFLTNRVIQIRAGLPLDGKFLQSTEGYAKTAGPAFLAARTETVQSSGFDEIAFDLHVAEHCDDCVREAARGFVKIGTEVPIGDRQCGPHDRCSARFRNSQTGEVMAA